MNIVCVLPGYDQDEVHLYYSTLYVTLTLHFFLFFNTRLGQCNCLPGFYGELCGLILTQAPYIEKDAVDDLCDTKKKRCHSFVIPGRYFIDSKSLMCKFTQFSVSE